jgi:hypothetical protein
MKKFLMALAGLISVAGTGHTAITANATVLASVTTVLSVALSGAPTNFTGVGASSTVLGNSAIVATNDGSGVTETYEVSIVDPTGPTWTSAGTPASDVYSLHGKFNSASPVGFNAAAAALLTTTPVLSSVTQFAGDQTAVNVPHLATRDLWLLFGAPTLSTFPLVQSITVVVTATLGS